MDQWERRTQPYPVRGHAMRTDSGRPSASMRLRTWTATSTSVARRLSVRERSPSPITLVAPDDGLGPGPVRVPGGLLPSHPASLGDKLEVAVPLRGGCLGRLARHRRGARGYDDGCLA